MKNYLFICMLLLGISLDIWSQEKKCNSNRDSD